MQVKTATRKTSGKPQSNSTDDSLTIPARTTKTITAFVDHPSEWNTTGTVTPLKKFTETKNLLVFLLKSTINDKKVAVRVTAARKSLFLIEKNTLIAKFSAVTEQSEFIKPVDVAILGMIPEADPDLTKYLNRLLRTNKPEQQINSFWCPTPEHPGKTEDHTPTQTLISKELLELKKKQKI